MSGEVIVPIVMSCEPVKDHPELVQVKLDFTAPAGFGKFIASRLNEELFRLCTETSGVELMNPDEIKRTTQ